MADYPAWLSSLADGHVHRACLETTPFRPDLQKVWIGWWQTASRGAEIRFADEDRLLFIHKTGAGFTYVFHPRFLVLQGDGDSLPDLRTLFRDRAGQVAIPVGRCEVAEDPPGWVLTVAEGVDGPAILRERFSPEEWERFSVPFRMV